MELSDLIISIVIELVDNPEEVDIKEVETDNQIILELKVAKDDFGKVIGKSGRNISAIRTVLFAVNAKKGGKKARLDVVE